MSRREILVVGAGLAGAVHARELAERGWFVTVIDKRPHIGGNAYDEIAPSGVRVHRYGPHLFHTNSESVVNWLSRFGAFVPYEHRVAARLPDGRCVPFPINRRTINAVFGLSLRDPDEVKDFLARQAVPMEDASNAAACLLSRIGPTLTDLFFRPYVRKMWELDLEDLHASVVRRVSIRDDDEDRYFPTDRFQVLPREGYADIFNAILSHERIRVVLGQSFDYAMTRAFTHCFNSMPIDEYFEFCLGELPYRSIRFHHRDVPFGHEASSAATTNRTDLDRFTRETDWSRLPNHVINPGPEKTVTLEEPCDYRDNDGERYYPVITSDGQFDAIYQRYKLMSRREEKVTFIGRCGTYQYLDMHQVINQSIHCVRAWSKRHSLV